MKANLDYVPDRGATPGEGAAGHATTFSYPPGFTQTGETLCPYIMQEGVAGAEGDVSWDAQSKNWLTKVLR